jgi:STE24 endopeptidase
LSARHRRLLPVGAAAAIAVALAAAAWILFHSSGPDGVELPAVDMRDHFTAAELDGAESYDRFVRIELVLSLVAVLVTLGLYARYGAQFARESAAGRIGTGMLLGMLGLGVLWFALLPFGLAELWWARRHDLAEIGYFEWVVGNFLGLGGEFLFICFALLIVMALAGWLGDHWWIPGGAAFVGLVVLFSFVAPYLLPAQERSRDSEVNRAARAFAAAQGEDEIPVYIEEIEDETTAPNAAAVGLGPTRRIILWDTLLDGRFADSEVRFVVAHEVAHHARDHLWKGAAWFALFAFPGAYLIARVTRRRGGMAEPRAVPLGLFVLTALSLAALPLDNAFTRTLETEADWVGLETARDPEGARALFRHFSTEARTDPTPPSWSYFFSETHPSVEERLAMVDAWEARRER